MDEYRISRTQKTCAGCNKGFEEKKVFFSVVLDTDSGLQRADYCGDCWDSVSEEEKSGFFSFWKTSIRPKEKRGRRPLDLETARDFFIRLHGAADPQKQNFLYLLTLLILRKRGLVHKKTIRENGGEIFLLHFPREEDTLYHVRVPLLDEDSLESIRTDFSDLLDMEL
ncbi:MAG: hypothetical protein ACYS8W_01885 [Planctomycetota bacterium]